MTNLVDGKDIIDAQGSVRDYESYYEVRQLESGESIEWSLQVESLVDTELDMNSLKASDLRVNLRVWVFRLLEGETLSFRNTHRESTRLVWRGQTEGLQVLP